VNVYIHTDLEGVAGFCFFEDREPKDIENVMHRQRMYRLLTGEVNAAAVAAFDSGAEEVYVNDSHYSGYNIAFEELDPRCRIIHGANCTGPHWMPKLDVSFDAMLLVGAHAMAGTPRAITSHSKWKVNGGEIHLSEGSMAAAIAGDFGVPTVMVSGDDKVTAEIGEKIPGIERVAVKEALSPYQACSLVPARARAEIAAATARGLGNRKSIKPYKIPGPVRLVLLDSENYEIYTSPLRETGAEVAAGTINEAFMQYQRAASWTAFDTEYTNGCRYP